MSPIPVSCWPLGRRWLAPEYFESDFAKHDGAKVRVTEVFKVGGNLVDGVHWDADAVFGESFVEGGRG